MYRRVKSWSSGELVGKRDPLERGGSGRGEDGGRFRGVSGREDDNGELRGVA